MEKQELTLEERFRFLTRVYFGDINDLFNVVGNRAFRDFSITIKYNNNISDQEKEQKKSEINKMIGEGLIGIKNTNKKEEFDSWHMNVCRRIVEIFEPLVHSFNYGQAQKWVNMMAKYLITLKYDEFKHLIPVLHVPIDNIVIDLADKQFGISSSTEKPWSQWDEKDYLDYQSKLNKGICEKYPDMYHIIWEFRFWKQSSSKKNKLQDVPRKQKRHNKLKTNSTKIRNNDFHSTQEKTLFPLQEDSDVSLESFKPFGGLKKRVYHDEFVAGYIIPLKDDVSNEEKKFMLFVAHYNNNYFCQIRYCYDRVDILNYRPFRDITQNKDGIKWERSGKSFPTFKSVSYGDGKESRRNALRLMKSILKDINAPIDVLDSIECE